MVSFSDNFFDKIQKKTNVSKNDILSLASKLQQSDLKNEGTLREIIHDLSKLTGKEVTNEKEEKIIQAIKNDKVPKNLDKML
ncbi:MAG: stage VI sporulation protein F [Bacilli bacterium]|nr:stage VI sporulation protein F [Bacilli bacterium]